MGRSNVGKSSLLNALVGSRLAKVSGTPGKTRMLNVYTVSGEWGVVRDGAGQNGPLPTPHSLYLLDLPGYGYARASKTDREGFRHLVRHALSRERLRGVVWLLDLRREPSGDDHDMQDLFAERGTRVLAALTKADKLPRRQRQVREDELRALLSLPDDQVIVTSAETAEGIAELRDAIGALVRDAVA